MRLGICYASALALLIVLVRIGHASDIGWPEAVARLTEERSKAEICVASLKGHGNADQVSQGHVAYDSAKAHFDGVIAGLILALSGAGDPHSLSSLQVEVASGASDLAAFCKTVDDLLSPMSEPKSLLGEAVKQAIEPMTNSLSEAIATIYNNFRGNKAATRMTICTELETAKWSNFDEVKAVE
jgi:hypothetical protein